MLLKYVRHQGAVGPPGCTSCDALPSLTKWLRKQEIFFLVAHKPCFRNHFVREGIGFRQWIEKAISCHLVFFVLPFERMVVNLFKAEIVR